MEAKSHDRRWSNCNTTQYACHGTAHDGPSGGQKIKLINIAGLPRDGRASCTCLFLAR